MWPSPTISLLSTRSRYGRTLLACSVFTELRRSNHPIKGRSSTVPSVFLPTIVGLTLSYISEHAFLRTLCHFCTSKKPSLLPSSLRAPSSCFRCLPLLLACRTLHFALIISSRPASSDSCSQRGHGKTKPR
jgi:hypothetical protein